MGAWVTASAVTAAEENLQFFARPPLRLRRENRRSPREWASTSPLKQARHIRFEIKRARLNAQALRPEFKRCNADPDYGNVRWHDKSLNRNALGAIWKHSEKYEHSVHSWPRNLCVYDNVKYIPYIFLYIFTLIILKYMTCIFSLKLVR